MSLNQNSLRVLIVDDSLCMRSLLRALLKTAEYDVVGELCSGSKLLSTVGKLTPHVICLDYNLPDADGLVLLKEIHETYPNVAVVMITADENPGLEQRAVEAGSAGFIRKPFSQEQIIAAMKKSGACAAVINDCGQET